jgi:hypothetical protein
MPVIPTTKTGHEYFKSCHQEGGLEYTLQINQFPEKEENSYQTAQSITNQNIKNSVSQIINIDPIKA